MSPDDPGPKSEKFADCVLKLGTEVCVALKTMLGFSFRECWENDPVAAQLVPSGLRGMALMGPGFYCREHKMLMINLEHPSVRGAKTLVVHQDFDLPPCVEGSIGLN